MISKYEKTNGVKLFALVAVLAMVFAGAAVMMDNGVDAAAKDPTYLSGAITSTQTFGDGTEVVVYDDLIIPDGMAMVMYGSSKLTINEGATLTIAAGGQLIIQQVTGTPNKVPTVIVNGSIVADGAMPADYGTKVGDTTPVAVDADYYGAIVNNTVYDAKTGTGLIVNGSITLEKGANITSNETPADVSAIEGETKDLPTGITITDVDTGGDIVLKNGATLNVNKRSANISEVEKQNVYIYQGATLNMNGRATDMTITAMGDSTYYTAGSMTLASTATEGRNSSSLVFTVTTQTTSGFISESVATITEAITIREYVLNVDGTIAADDTLSIVDGVHIYNGSETGWDADADKYNPTKTDANGDVVIDTTKTLVTKTSVSGSLTVDAKGYLTIADDTETSVSGNIVVKYDKTDTPADGTVQIQGDIIVSGTVSLNWESVKATAGGMIIMDGGAVDVVNMEIDGNATNPQIYLYGAFYYTEDNSSDTTYHIRDLDVAISEATAAQADEVAVYSYGTAASASTYKDAVSNGAYVLDVSITIPEGMELIIAGAVAVTTDASITFADGAEVSNAFNGKIYVDGKVIDQGGAFYGYDGDNGYLVYEVKKISEDELTTTYTSLTIALGEAQPGETIEVVRPISITSNMTIPADVTVVAAADDGGSKSVSISNGAVLTINGTLELDNSSTIDISKDGENADGSIVLNGIIANATDSKITVGGATGNHAVAGAYFIGTIGDYEGVNFITSVSVAAEASSTVEENGISIYGKLSMGDVTFTQGETDSLDIKVYNEVSAGTVTLVGNGITFDIKDNSTSFTGAVTYSATAGTVTFDFTKAKGVAIETTSSDDGTTVTTGIAINGELSGSATLSEGSAVIGTGGLTVNGYADKVKSVFTVANGATLDLNTTGVKITVSLNNNLDGIDDYAGLVVAGTLNLGKGEIDNKGIIDIVGTLNINENSKTIGNKMNVAGTLAVSENNTLNVNKVYVGSAAESLGVGGTIAGAVKTDAFIVAYAGADISGAAINENNGETDAEVTAYYINGTLYMTSYAVSGTDIATIIPGTIELTGYEPVVYNEGADKKGVSSWYTDETMKEPFAYDSDKDVDGITALYAKAEVSQALVYVSVGSNMTVYIDDVRYSNGAIFALDVGQHTISVQVNAGYTGETSVLVGGTAVTGGTFEITPQMAEDYSVSSSLTGVTSTDCVVISVSGSIAIDSGATGGDDGMGLTEILLVILVILIVVMAIMVALRLMRS